ncbi:MAG: LamG-like jellyroll fold domain-containing protein [Verrucomicrobiota bacterium]|nr:LamG-like jellyroll fold domain-containing protein [Verrucomicrobiota bacterium]
MKTLSKHRYACLASLRHQGYLFVMGARVDDTTAKITYEYRLLDLGVYDETAPLDEDHWTELSTLKLPDGYRSNGMNLINITTDDPMSVEETTFTLVSDESFLYLFRRSPQGTVYLNRFVFSRTTLLIEPTWETRYRRSENTDYTFNKNDSFSSRDMEGKPFHEPTLEFTMARPVANSRVPAFFTVDQSSGGQLIHIVVQSSASNLEVYTFPQDRDGLPIFPQTITVPPSAVLSLKDGPAILSAAASLFTLQEAVDFEDSPSLKRGVRALFAFPLASSKQVVTLDVGISNLGMLASIPEPLVLSTMTEPGTLPVLVTTESGQTVRGAILDYYKTSEPLSLLPSTDGDLYLYGNASGSLPDHAFVFSIYTTRVTRAIYRFNTNSDKALMDALARQSGTLRNSATLVLTDKAGTTLGDLDLSSDGGGVAVSEKWFGIPRHVTSFQSILSGLGDDQPYASNIRNGNTPFFDYADRWRMLACPLKDANNQHQGTLALIQNAPRASLSETMTCALTVDAGAARAKAVLSIVINGITAVETWDALPADSLNIRTSLNGLAKNYNYAENTSVEHAICRTWCGSGSIWFITKDKTVESATVKVETVSDTLCSITLSVKLAADTNPRTESYEVSRSPAAIVAAINDGAGGKPASTLFVAMDALATGIIASQRVAGGQLSGGSQLATVVSYGQGLLTENTVVELIQKLEAGDARRSSGLFDFKLLTFDPNLTDFLVSPGTATQEQSGTDSSWLQGGPRPSVFFNNSAITIDAQTNMKFSKAVTLEAWVKPDPIVGDNARIFQYASTESDERYALGLRKISGETGYGIYGSFMEASVVSLAAPVVMDDWQHVAFTYHTGYDLRFDGLSYVDCGNGESLNTGKELTLEVWVKPGIAVAQPKYLMSKFGGNRNNQAYLLSIENNDVVFKFLSSMLNKAQGGQNYLEYTLRAPLTGVDSWHHIAARVQFKNETKVSGIIVEIKTYIVAQIFVNGVPAGTALATEITDETLSINVSRTNFYIGALNAITTTAPEVFRIADCRVWNRLLTNSEIKENFTTMRLATTTNGLVAFWMMNEGEGRTINDATKLNNGILNNPEIWRETRLGASWALYLNGQPLDVSLSYSNAVGGFGKLASLIGCSDYSEIPKLAYAGKLDEIRVWSDVKTQEALVDAMYSSLDGEEKELQAYWRMDQGSGDTVEDSSFHNNLGTFAPAAAPFIKAQFTLANNASLPVEMMVADSEVTGIVNTPVDGAFEFRVATEAAPSFTAFWDDSTYKLKLQIDSQPAVALSPGVAVPLPDVATMKLKVSVDGQAITAIAQSLTVPVQPEWVEIDGAPVGLDAPWVREIPGGNIEPENAVITGTPFAAEYGDVQKDAYGNTIGIMKRAHAYLDVNGFAILQTSFKVGETELQYIGQIQTKPTLIGYIEGAPPVPSENMTTEETKPLSNEFYGASSVEVLEEYNESFLYTGSSNSYFDMSLDSKVGFNYGSETSAGIGVEQEIFKLEGKVGLHVKAETSMGMLSSVAKGASTGENFVKSMALNGFWEFPKDYDQNGIPRLLNPEVGRRYIPNNLGYALVKSGTADLFAMRMRGTGAIVNYVVQPNKDIPRDWNIIAFPIDPSYVKNGTLDGMVGLVADPQYPNAIRGELGSYFKPVEAYSLKSKIEKERAMIEGYFAQQNSIPILGTSAMDTPDGELLRDWDQKISKRDMVNTYVWNAAGGFYSVEEQYSDVKSESQGGEFTLSMQSGVYGEIAFLAGSVGMFADADVLFGSRIENSQVTTEDYSDTFSLKVNLSLTGWLNQWNDTDNRYEEFPAPGKVDNYRFMSYYLAPKVDNFNTFFSTVIDQSWLFNSNAPAAIALQSAMSQQTAPWRVLHRVTFVSRIPPQMKLSPDINPVPTVQRPVNIALNEWLIALVNQQLIGKPHTRGNIDTAVDVILDVELPLINPYWKQFLEYSVAHPDSNDAYQVAEIRRYNKAYLYDYYLTNNNLGQA